jgi:hypothetical protein
LCLKRTLEQTQIAHKRKEGAQASSFCLIKNNGNDKKAFQKDKREKKKHIKLRQRIKMERILLRHKNRLSCKEPKMMTKMISLAMNWKDWSVYYKVVNGTPKGEADRIFKLIANKEKKQDEFIPVLKMLL